MASPASPSRPQPEEAKITSAEKIGKTEKKDGKDPKSTPALKLPYTFELDEPLEYAPEKPKEDPFAILLKPLLEHDTAQCKSWNEEVQNLLIFAGLFSAVVTAFVVDSYKPLQPDPNQAIIGLLFYIATHLDDPLDNASLPSLPPTLASIAESYSPNSSSIRINSFWFISLILSLTTVLVGTISLQWLREHQAYPTEFSFKERLAVYHMRSKAMEAWYVPQVFAALPLLLQAALALFFAGMVDFSLLLGSSIAVPVCVLIAITLLFLLATTVLPTLQALAICVPSLLSRRTAPTPCPYKSPQSAIFRALSVFLLFYPFRLVFRLAFYVPFRFIYPSLITRYQFAVGHVLPYLSDIWRRKTWANFDLGWLFIRDACQQRMFDKEADLYKHGENLSDLWSESENFPLCDITQSLCEAVDGAPGSKYAEYFVVAAYHCFSEISEPIFMRDYSYTLSHDSLRQRRRNKYFYELLNSKSDLSDFLVDTVNDYRTYWYHSHVLHYEHIFIFLRNILQKHASSVLSKHRQELKMRMMWTLLANKCKTVNLSARSKLATVCSVLYTQIWYDDQGANSAVTIMDVLAVLFTHVASDNCKQEDLMCSLHTSPGIPDMLLEIAEDSTPRFAHPTLTWKEGQNGSHYRYTSDQYVLVFELIAQHLDRQLKSYQLQTSINVPSLLFYLASFFVRPFVFVEIQDWRNINMDRSRGLNMLLEVMRTYKERTAGSVNADLEERFEGYDLSSGCDRFSEQWWAFLEHQNSGLLTHSNAANTSTNKGNAEDLPPLVPSTDPPNASNTAFPTPSDSPQDITVNASISPSLISSLCLE